jgi:hypothetical protein
MTIQSQRAANTNPFDAAKEKFSDVIDALHGTDLGRMSHDKAEEYISREGREVVRRLLQGYLDLRSFDDAGAAVVGADGVVRNHRRTRSVTLTSIVGDVEVTRMHYGARGHASLVPLDAALNMPCRQHSLGLQKRLAEEIARGSYDEAVAAVKRHSGVDVAKHQAETIARVAARDFDAFYRACRKPALVDTAARAGASSDDIVTLTTDAKGIVMLPGSLRDGTRRAAQDATPKLDKRVSRGEKRNRKRMAQVASVYTVAPHPRTPHEVAQELRQCDDASPRKRPRPQNKRVWASAEKPAEDVIDDVFREALARDPNRTRRWVALVDGNPFQLDAILERAKHYDVQPTVIIDIIHVLEYLWKAAWCFFIEGHPDVEDWVQQRFLAILSGHASRVAAGIRRAATRQGLSSDARRAVDVCANYLLKYKAHLRYDIYLAAGFPIATGVIEGACRYLVKDRMDITGARWSLDGAEAVLRLRALRASGHFDAYWRFHQEQELQRNHRIAYARAEIPDMIAAHTPAKRRRVHLRIVK